MTKNYSQKDSTEEPVQLEASELTIILLSQV